MPCALPKLGTAGADGLACLCLCPRAICLGLAAAGAGAICTSAGIGLRAGSPTGEIMTG